MYSNERRPTMTSGEKKREECPTCRCTIEEAVECATETDEGYCESCVGAVVLYLHDHAADLSREVERLKDGACCDPTHEKCEIHGRTYAVPIPAAKELTRLRGELDAAKRDSEPPDDTVRYISKRPKRVCLCGSTRFADVHAITRWELERDGSHICLMINYLPARYADEQGWDGNDHFGEAANCKEILGELHWRKIDLCDEVLVLNVGGYIGESTRGEIEYAKRIGKPVRYLEPIDAAMQQQDERAAVCELCGGTGEWWPDNEGHKDFCTCPAGQRLKAESEGE